MSDLHVKYLLIGGGLASFAAAEAIRVRDPIGPLVLIGQESSRPYRRVPLSKGFLRRQQTRESLFTAEPDWFVKHTVELRTGTRAAHLDAARSVVTLDNGEAITFDKLLIATGASPRQLDLPGSNLPGVFYLRTIEDAERLHTAIDKAKSEGRKWDDQGVIHRGRAAVIGGGLLGVEVATSLAQSGIGVDLVVGSSHPWSHFAGPATGKFVSRLLQKHGVTVHDAIRAQRVEGDGRVQRLSLSDASSVPCDFLVATVGTAVNKELLRGTPVVAEKAVLVNEHCRTSEVSIFAAGDCAAVRDNLFGRYRAAGPWDTAAATGAIAGANMVGDERVFDEVTHVSTELFGVPVWAWGQAAHVDRRLLRGAPNVDAPDFVEIGVAPDGRISYAIGVGPHASDPVLADLVKHRVKINGNEERLKDPGKPLDIF